MSTKQPLTGDQLQALTHKFAGKIEKKLGGFGPGKGFAIMVWDQTTGMLQHVTTSRAEFADMIGAQLSDWAKTLIREEDAEMARRKQQANGAVTPPPVPTQQH